MQDRYLAQLWSDKDQRYITRRKFQDNDEHRQTAIEYIDWLMLADNAPESGRVYDQKEQTVIHQASNIPF
ncbi:MAG: hypothetical protein KC423_00580 [Anaerolineales bacterium]|nr:hypothetical protein [Anaerolineales bacterium]